MNIGLLTFQNTNNFGACLQAVAHYKVLASMGVDVELVDYRNRRISRVESGRLIDHSIKGIISYFLFDRGYSRRKLAALSGEMRDLCLHSPAFTIDDVAAAASRYDRLMVGSDQVWALDVTDNDYTYFLDFVDDDSKKYAFSASISNEKLFVNDPNVKNLIGRFRRIAVRESQAADAIESMTGREVDVVCDPTMLLSSREWDDLLHPEFIEGEYALIYFKDPEDRIFDDARRWAEANQCKVLFVGPAKPREGISVVKPCRMSEFVGLIKGAKAVFTASYHGMLFALYYNRPLIYYNRNQKSRMQSLSDLLGIGANDGAKFENGVVPAIDYDRVNSTMSDFRDRSLDILSKMIEK